MIEKLLNLAKENYNTQVYLINIIKDISEEYNVSNVKLNNCFDDFDIYDLCIDYESFMFLKILYNSDYCICIIGFNNKYCGIQLSIYDSQYELGDNIVPYKKRKIKDIKSLLLKCFKKYEILNRNEQVIKDIIT